MWTQLYGLYVLEADDAHGHGRGLVVQHDGIRGANVLAVAAFAATVIDPGAHPAVGCRGIPGGGPSWMANRRQLAGKKAWSTPVDGGGLALSALSLGPGRVSGVSRSARGQVAQPAQSGADEDCRRAEVGG